MALTSNSFAPAALPVRLCAEDLRIRALERLYLRREVVVELIRSLEQYAESAPALAPCVSITVGRKCS